MIIDNGRTSAEVRFMYVHRPTYMTLPFHPCCFLILRDVIMRIQLHVRVLAVQYNYVYRIIAHGPERNRVTLTPPPA